MPVNTHQLSNNELWQIRATRWKARTDLLFLCRSILGFNDAQFGKGQGVQDDVHGPLVSKLQKFVAPPPEKWGEYDYLQGSKWHYKPFIPMYDLVGPRRTLILDSRGHLKTTINATAHAIQWALNYPDLAMAIFQATDTKAQSILRGIKIHFQSNPIFRELFPEHCPKKSSGEWGTRTEITSEARAATCSIREATFTTGAIEKGMAGYHFDVMKFSDIVEPTNVVTKEQIISVYESFQMAENLLVRPTGWIDVEGTRYNFGDTYGRIIEKEQKRRKEGKPEQWNFYIRGCYKKAVENPQFSVEELDEKDLLDADGHPVPWWPQRWTFEELDKKRADNPYIFGCTAAGSPILMDDWTEKPIDKVVVGDIVMGWSKIPGHRKEHLVPSKVTAIGGHNQWAHKITLDNGQEIICTPDHLWWDYKKANRQAKEPYSIRELGDELAAVVSPLPEWVGEKRDAALWLGGLLDGEGTFSRHSEIAITQSTCNSEVCAKIDETLRLLNIPFDKEVQRTRPNGDILSWRIRDGRSVKRWIYLQCSMAKRHKIKVQLDASRGKARDGLHKIVKVEPIGEIPVFWLQTETRNYIVCGHKSRNCQQRNNPLDDESQHAFPLKNMCWTPRTEFDKVPISFHTVTVDTADTQNARSKFTAITVVGWSQSGRAFLHDVRHGRFLPDEIIFHLFDINKKYRPLSIKIEDVAFVRGLMPSIYRAQETGILMFRDQKIPIPAGTYLPIEQIKRDTEISKTERILNTLQPWYMSGELRFVKDGDDPPAWWEQMMYELSRFPYYEYNDIIDALADQFQGREYFGRNQARAENEEQKAALIAQRWQAVQQEAFKKFTGETVEYDVPRPGNEFFVHSG